MYGCKNKADSTLKLHARVFPLMMSKNASNKVKCILSEGFQTVLLTFKIKVRHLFLWLYGPYLTHLFVTHQYLNFKFTTYQTLDISYTLFFS